MANCVQQFRERVSAFQASLRTYSESTNDSQQRALSSTSMSERQKQPTRTFAPAEARRHHCAPSRAVNRAPDIPN